MPVAAVALAAGSFIGGATALAAATTVTGAVLAGATMVGSAMTAVGTITGNKTLTKIGAVVGIAGGLGSIANSLSSTADAAASGASDAASGAAGDVADNAASSATDAASSAVGDAVQTYPVSAPGSVDALGSTSANTSTTGLLGSPGATTATAGTSAGTTAAGQGAGLLDSDVNSAAANAVSGSGNDLLSQSLQTPNSMFDPTTVSGTGTTANPFDASATTVGQTTNLTPFKAPTTNSIFGQAGQSTGGGLLDSIESNPGAIDAAAASDTTAASGIGATVDQVQAWAKQNPVLAQAALSGSGALLKGVLPSAKDKAMMAAYQAQSGLTSAQTAALNRRALWGSGHIS